MAYEATICRITTSPHPNADRLQLADAAGYTCIVGLDHEDGELGIVFPEGGQLVHEFAMVNGLYRKHPETGEPMGGYLDENRRIRALKLRGVESNALWLPLSAVEDWLVSLQERVPAFFEGDTLTEVGGRALCGKYYTPATLKAMRSQNPAKRKEVRRAQALDKHYDTPQLRASRLPPGEIIITEKLHGTSGRTGFVEVEQPQRWFVRALNRLPFVNIRPRKRWEIVSGTRNCILETDGLGEKAKGYRFEAHRRITPYLRPGEVWYYELCGYEDSGAPIMAPHAIEKIGDSTLEKKLIKANFGPSLVYHYGCKPGTFRIDVYRITQDGRDLPWDEVVDRVEWAGLDVVPLLERHLPGTWVDGEIRHRIEELTRGPSCLGNLPIREGVCVRVESVVDGETIVHKSLKHKGFVFCALEGIRKNDPDYVDAEEVA